MISAVKMSDESVHENEISNVDELFKSNQKRQRSDPNYQKNVIETSIANVLDTVITALSMFKLNLLE